MTPWQFSLYLEGYNERRENEHNKDAWMMYHGALLTRVKEPPKLEKFLLGRKPVKGIDEDAILAAFRSYQDRRNREKHG